MHIPTSGGDAAAMQPTPGLTFLQGVRVDSSGASSAVTYHSAWRKSCESLVAGRGATGQGCSVASPAMPEVHPNADWLLVHVLADLAVCQNTGLTGP